MTASSEEGSTDDTESISDSSDSADEEIREIERRDNNPFNTMSIPKEQPNLYLRKYFGSWRNNFQFIFFSFQ